MSSISQSHLPREELHTFSLTHQGKFPLVRRKYIGSPDMRFAVEGIVRAYCSDNLDLSMYE